MLGQPSRESSSDPLSAFDLKSLEPFGVQISPRGAGTLGDLPPGLLEQAARDEKLVLLRGFAPIVRDDFLAYCRSFPGRSLLEWDFGPVMEMHEKPDVKNYLFSREAVPFHWDGAFHKVPSFLMFYCVQAPVRGAGGETLFCDTGRVWDGIDAVEQSRLRAVELTYETRKVAHYGGKVVGPLVDRHPVTGATILRYAEPVETSLNPVTLGVDGLSGSTPEEFLAHMRRRIYSDSSCYSHAWEDGDVLMADNHALIHGRRAFERDCPRHLRRIQLL